jgi:hypothetical protein
MTKDWIDRYTCDRCGERVEQLHSDEKWPEGWKNVGITGDAQRLMCPACMGFVRAALRSTPP